MNRPISTVDSNEVNCLGTCGVSLPFSILIITQTKPPYQSDWILERKLKMSKAIKTAAASLSASQNPNIEVRGVQPSSFSILLLGKKNSMRQAWL